MQANNPVPNLTTYEGNRAFRIELAKRAGYTLNTYPNESQWFLRSPFSGSHELPFDVNNMNIKESDIWASDYVYDGLPDWTDAVDNAMMLLPEDKPVVMSYDPKWSDWAVKIGDSLQVKHSKLSTAICLAFWEYTNASQ